MTRLDNDIDNFSGRNSRGTRYNIVADGNIIYHDVPESSVDSLCDDIARFDMYDNIEAIEI